MNSNIKLVCLYHTCQKTACYCTSACVVLIFQVWEGKGVVKTARQMLGETDPVS